MIVLITGAAQGLGLELVREAAVRGHRVIAGVRRMEGAEALRQLQNEYPGAIRIAPLDVSDERAIAAARASVEAEEGRVDAIVNNAGILLARDEAIETLDFGDMEKSMATNLYGPMRIVKHFLPLMLGSDSPCIMNISSEAGCFSGAYGGDYPYAVSKAALNFFTAQLRSKLSPEGYAVYAIHPGWIRTTMGGEAAPGDPRQVARSLMALAEREVEPDREAWMIDHQGAAMPF
ncbi:SDR family NAD(P)-dependent oxidoreductase [Paenibacillus sp. NFR01]|uniref:SDR family NAD(P)-dependent oxidoreductase n=1 Tax=Paenibacillus sp. NFR01 TaxID=1566279 RepID=UPI0008D5448F|nr:SDR family NAD(P)-dependent oxidoreductase [Paenibacillus sp. NFR01]SEU02740.1 Short-chain dehydrogenase [Paenibacillus sp. NFR01]